MFPSGTSIAQGSPLRKRASSDNWLAARWPVAEAKPERCVDLQSPSKLFSHFVSSQTFFFFSPSPLSERHQMFVENLSVTDDGSSCWKRADWSDKTLGFLGGGQRTTQGGVMYRATPGSSKHGGWICWQAGLSQPDMGYRGYWSTGTGKAQRANVLILTRSGRNVCACLDTGSITTGQKKMQSIWDNCLLFAKNMIFKTLK